MKKVEMSHYYNDADIEDLERRQAIVANHLGKEAVSEIAKEECSELIKALTKIWRAEHTTFASKSDEELLEDLKEEIADVQSCINNLKLIYNISDDEIYNIRDFGIKRAFGRYNLKD